MPVAGLGSAALQSLTLLQIRARLCRYLRATLCHISELGSAEIQSSALPAFTAQLCFSAEPGHALKQGYAVLDCENLLSAHLHMLTATKLS